MNLKLGQRVNVKCPVYKTGRKYSGIITEISIDKQQYKVRIDGNKKSTVFSHLWVFELPNPHFSELTKAMFRTTNQLERN